MVAFWGWRVDGSRDERSTPQGEGPMGMWADEPQIGPSLPMIEVRAGGMKFFGMSER